MYCSFILLKKEYKIFCILQCHLFWIDFEGLVYGLLYCLCVLDVYIGILKEYVEKTPIFSLKKTLLLILVASVYLKNEFLCTGLLNVIVYIYRLLKLHTGQNQLV